MKKLLDMKKIVGAVSALGFPMLAAAATVDSLVDTIKATLNLIIGLLFVLVTFWFLWGVVKYVAAGGDETKMKDGKKHMIWGIIGMAVMAGAWGIVNIIVTYFGVGGGVPTIVPLP